MCLQRNCLIPFSIWAYASENHPWFEGLKVHFKSKKLVGQNKDMAQNAPPPIRNKDYFTYTFYAMDKRFDLRGKAFTIQRVSNSNTRVYLYLSERRNRSEYRGVPGIVEGPQRGSLRYCGHPLFQSLLILQSQDVGGLPDDQEAGEEDDRGPRQENPLHLHRNRSVRGLLVYFIIHLVKSANCSWYS